MWVTVSMGVMSATPLAIDLIHGWQPGSHVQSYCVTIYRKQGYM